MLFKAGPSSWAFRFIYTDADAPDLRLDELCLSKLEGQEPQRWLGVKVGDIKLHKPADLS